MYTAPNPCTAEQQIWLWENSKDHEKECFRQRGGEDYWVKNFPIFWKFYTGSSLLQKKTLLNLKVVSQFLSQVRRLKQQADST